MPTATRSLSLSDDAKDFLLSQFRAVARPCRRRRRGWTALAAITYRPCKQGRDAIPDRPILLEDFRLLAATYRRADDPRGGPGWRPALAVYRAVLDFPGTGKIVFRCESASDLPATRHLIYPRPNYTAIRAATLLLQGLRDAEAADLATAPRLPNFYFGFDAHRLPRFEPGDLDAARSSELAIDGRRAWPAELFRRHGRTTLVRPAGRIFACLAGLKGRRVRNPAFAVLQRHGLLPSGLSYKAWLGSVSVSTRGGRLLQDPHAEGTEAARVRRTIGDYVLADPGREARLLADLREAGHAVGVKIIPGGDGVDALAELLDNPWSDAPVGYAAAIQAIRPAGSPGQARLRFADDVTDLDLFDLGTDGNRSGAGSPAGPTSARRSGRGPRPSGG